MNTVFSMNYATHYREVIYKKLNDELDADFYFGNPKKLSIRKLDFSQLSNFKKEFRTYEFKKFVWYAGNIDFFLKKYDNIVLTGEYRILNNWLILLFARLTGQHVYLWSHGWYGRESKRRTFIKKIFFNLSYKVFLYGNYAKELMKAEGIKTDKLVPVFNSLDYDKQLSVRKTLNKTDVFKDSFKNTNPIIIFIGRVQRNKKLEQVLDAMMLLKLRGYDYNFVVIGKEETNFDFKSEILKRKLTNRVWLYGACYDENIIGELIYNSDVCVSPGVIGLTAIHSLMYGTPVITNDDFTRQGPEFEAIKDGYNGAFFQKDNIENLSEQIKAVINAQYPKEQCYEVVDKIWNPHNQIEIFKKELLA